MNNFCFIFQAKLEEIIINFWQPWPMFDFPMEVEEKPEEEEEEGEGDQSDKDSDKASQKTDKGTGSQGSSRRNSFRPGTHAPDADLSKEIMELQNKLEGMKTYRPAGGQYVDIIFLLPEKTEDSDWLMEWSEHSHHESSSKMDGQFDYLDSPV